MYLKLNEYSPKIRLGLVSASRNCFPRKLSEERAKRLIKAAAQAGVKLTVPKGESWIIESREHAQEAAKQLAEAGCQGAILYLGNFSPEMEDAVFVRQFPGKVLILAAEEESSKSLANNRGDALCGLLSAVLAVSKRGLSDKVLIPEQPLVSAEKGAQAILHFEKVLKTVHGISNATLGLFGPRPRDFESVNYNIASLAGIGVEVEELALFDLENAVKAVKENEAKGVLAAMRKEMGAGADPEFLKRLAVYEKALLNFRDKLKLSGMATQCWAEQEFRFRHVPCYINSRLADRGFPVACENDAYSLTSELMGQYASDASVTILDINHTIPKDLHPSLSKIPSGDAVGMFHCGNTALRRMKAASLKHQIIMKRLMEPDTQPDITRGTLEGQIAASPITVLQVHGSGDALRAYIIEGSFLDIDPKTFGATGTAHLPGFSRFYRHVLLGRFHHHAAVAFTHCGAVLFDAFKLLGVKEVYTPLPESARYPGENPFA